MSRTTTVTDPAKLAEDPDLPFAANQQPGHAPGGRAFPFRDAAEITIDAPVEKVYDVVVGLRRRVDRPV